MLIFYSLRYGKSLLGLSREESGVLGDGVPGANNEDDDEGTYLMFFCYYLVSI